MKKVTIMTLIMCLMTTTSFGQTTCSVGGTTYSVGDTLVLGNSFYSNFHYISQSNLTLLHGDVRGKVVIKSINTNSKNNIKITTSNPINDELDLYIIRFKSALMAGEIKPTQSLNTIAKKTEVERLKFELRDIGTNLLNYRACNYGSIITLVSSGVVLYALPQDNFTYGFSGLLGLVGVVLYIKGINEIGKAGYKLRTLSTSNSLGIALNF